MNGAQCYYAVIVVRDEKRFLNLHTHTPCCLLCFLSVPDGGPVLHYPAFCAESNILVHGLRRMGGVE